MTLKIIKLFKNNNNNMDPLLVQEKRLEMKIANLTNKISRNRKNLKNLKLYVDARVRMKKMLVVLKKERRENRAVMT